MPVFPAIEGMGCGQVPSPGRFPWLWEGQQHKQEWEKQQEPGKTSFGSYSPRPVEGKLNTTAAVLLSKDDFVLSCPKAGMFILTQGCVSITKVSGFALAFTRVLKILMLGLSHLTEMKLN